MNNSLQHLPERNRENLHRLAETICERCNDVTMIVLYGSYARGDYKTEEDQAAFELQQAAECAYKALLLVYTNYTPYNHISSGTTKRFKESLPTCLTFFHAKPKNKKNASKTSTTPTSVPVRSEVPDFLGRPPLLRRWRPLLMSETESRCKAFLNQKEY